MKACLLFDSHKLRFVSGLCWDALLEYNLVFENVY